MRPIGRWTHKQISFDQFVVGLIRGLRQGPKFFERVLPHQRREGHRTCRWSIYDLHRLVVKLDSNTLNMMSLGNAYSGSVLLSGFSLRLCGFAWNVFRERIDFTQMRQGVK